MEIGRFSKPGKDIVVEINDVEYVLGDKAISSIENNDRKVDLVQLYDQRHYLFTISTIMDSLFKHGVVGYLDKKN